MSIKETLIWQKCGGIYHGFVKQEIIGRISRVLRKYDIAIGSKYKKLKRFHQVHKGERCFIIGNGPSLTIEDLEKLENEVTFASNEIVYSFEQTSWRPTYFGCGDGAGYDVFKEYIRYEDFKATFFSDWLGAGSLFWVKDERVDKLPIVGEAKRIKRGKMQKIPRFSDNSYYCIYAAGSISYYFYQLAAYMGVREIYLLGMDCDYTGEQTHFIVNEDTREFKDNSTDKFLKELGEGQQLLHRAAKEYFDDHDVKVYNATRGGKLEIFPRISFDELFNKKEEKKE